MCAARNGSGFRIFRTSVVLISRDAFGRRSTEQGEDKMTNACSIPRIDPEVENIGLYGYYRDFRQFRVFGIGSFRTDVISILRDRALSELHRPPTLRISVAYCYLLRILEITFL